MFEKRRMIVESDVDYEEGDIGRIPITLYEPRNWDGRWTILLLHGIGRRRLSYLDWYCQAFARLGFRSSYMILPYHYERTPDSMKSGEAFLDVDNDTLKRRFMNAVEDVIKVSGILKEDSDKLALMGISFGGMIAVITMAKTDSIDRGILLVTGGNFQYITWESVATKVLRIKYESDSGGCTHEKCREIHERHYERYVESLKVVDDVGKVPAFMKCFEYDPSTFAKFVKIPILMITALFDIFIPRKASRDLKNRLPYVKEYLIPTGHLSSFLMRGFIVRKVFKFLGEGE